MRGIEVGSKVRSHDFPGSDLVCFVEGIVTAIEDNVATIHVTKDVHEGKEVPLGPRLVVKAHLGMGFFSKAFGVEKIS